MNDKSINSGAISKYYESKYGLKYLSSNELSIGSRELIENLSLEYHCGITSYHILDFLRNSKFDFSNNLLRDENDFNLSFNRYIEIFDISKKEEFENLFFPSNVLLGKIKGITANRRKSILQINNKTNRVDYDLVYRGLYTMDEKFNYPRNFLKFLEDSKLGCEGGFIVQNTLIKFEKR